jgi:hypothetical protein
MQGPGGRSSYRGNAGRGRRPSDTTRDRNRRCGFAVAVTEVLDQLIEDAIARISPQRLL